MTSSRRIYRQFAIWFLVTLAWLGGSAKVQAEDFLENVETSFNIHGYLENQEIIRNENFVKNYHVASIRSRLDVQPSGQLFKDLDFGPITKGSVSYFVELRPGYEGAYDIVNDRFGNRPTGFSGTGFSPFSGPPISNGAGVALLRLFGYDVKRFKFYGARNFAFPEPVAPNAVFLIPCVHCGGVSVTENDLKFERDDSNRDYYPLREAYLDIGGDLGALIVHTDAAMAGVEVEISPTGQDDRRSHKDVLQREINGLAAYTAVFDKVREGTYTLWVEDAPRARDVAVAAGAIAELDWR